MKTRNIILSACAGMLMSVSMLASAESLVDGVYQSEGDDKGTGKCTLQLISLDEAHKYGDQAFELESSGEGSCEWSAIGMSKSFRITAGLITNSGTPAFVKAAFPFGPAGGRLEITTFELDGSVRNNQIFTKVDEKVLHGGG